MNDGNDVQVGVLQYLLGPKISGKNGQRANMFITSHLRAGTDYTAQAMRTRLGDP